MADVPDPLAALQPQVNQLVAQIANQAVRPNVQSRQNIIYTKFLNKPLTMHKELNPNHPILDADGVKFELWKKAFDRTLTHAFCRAASFLEIIDHFDALEREEAVIVDSLIRNTVEIDLLNIINATTHESVKALYEFVVQQCQHSDRRHKTGLLDKVFALMSDPNPAKDSTLSTWSQIGSDLKQLNVSLDEALGIFLQSTYKPPHGIDTTTFNFSVTQTLEAKASPDLKDVVSTIQFATSKHRPKGAALESTAMELDRINAFQGRHQNKYVAPQRRSTTPDKPRVNRPRFSVDRANHFRGKGQSDELITKYGTTCSYCSKNGHWYADCLEYWRAVGTKEIEAPPRDYESKTSTYIPPRRSEHHVRKVNFPDVTEGVLLDSGASAHVSGDSTLFIPGSKLTKPRTFYLAVSDCNVTVDRIGTVRIPTPTGVITIPNVYHVPGVDGVILSTGRLLSDGWKLEYEGTKATLLDPFRNSYSTVFHNYCWNLKTDNEFNTLKKVTQSPSFDPYVWHVRLGHASEDIVKAYLKLNFPDLKLKWTSFFCDRCAKSKSIDKKAMVLGTQIPRDKPLDFMVSDVAGPFEHDISGRRYIVTLRDHASTYTYCTSMIAKSDVPEKIMNWMHHLKNKFGRYPAYLRCDNAPEYVESLKPLLDKVGVTLAPVTPYSPQQNGEAERLNRTLGDMARTMLHESDLPRKFWSYAYSTAAYMHNRIPNSRTGNKCPIQIFYGTDPDPNSIYPFGAKAIVHIPKDRRKKLDERAQEGLMLGYPEAGVGWLFWLPRERRMVHSASVKFPDFQSLPIKKKQSKSDLDFILNQIILQLGEERTEEFAAEEQRQLTHLHVGPEHELPRTIKTALAGTDSEEWRLAATYEMGKFGELGVWVPVDPYKGIKVLGARWVFSIKRKPDGTVDKFRARYVAKGFNQQLGQDCNETYAPTASLNTLRLLISISLRHQFPTASFDVSSAYLYSPIEEEVYVQPPVEICPELKGKVMLLKKAMYGTKQAARCWWKFFKKTVEGLGFVASEIEPSLYLFKKDTGFVIIWLHVDDGFAMASDLSLLNELRQGMTRDLEIKWSNSVERLVGIDIKRSKRTVELSQKVLAGQIIQKYNRQVYIKDSPLNVDDLEIYSGDPVDPTDYRSIIGSLMYLSSGTRPDLSFPVNLLARFCSNPSAKHWMALDCLIGYLKKTVDRKLVYSSSGDGLQLWTDANWGGEHERSTTGYVLTHCGDAIAWGSRRQTVVALSTCAAEYVALSEGSQILSHVLNMLEDLDYHPKTTIHVDNQAAILIASDNASKKKTKYLKRAFYFVNDLIREEGIQLIWTSTIDQLADIFTKKLGSTKMLAASRKLNLIG